jgi:hypothetical protein
MGNHRRDAAGLQARLIGGREANLRPYRLQVNRPGQLDFLIAGTVDWSRANREREMTDIRKQVLFAASSKAAFKPRSDIEGLGRKLRAMYCAKTSFLTLSASCHADVVRAARVGDSVTTISFHLAPAAGIDRGMCDGSSLRKMNSSPHVRRAFSLSPRSSA